jgi:non-ribosomal peptide synthetase component F
MYIIPDDCIYDPPALCAFLLKHGITEMLFTPSLLQAVLDTQERQTIVKSFATMRKIWLCGEVVTVTLMELAAKLLPNVLVLNLYSISECHDIAVADLSAWWHDQMV